MHYYQFNIGDYAKATRHLSNTEDLAYRRLIELYYDTERPLIIDVVKLSRLINMRDNQEEIKTVLEDFFVEAENGFKQNRIDSEIANYHAKAESARVNGKKGGRPRKATANPTETESKAKKTQSVNLDNPTKTESKAKKSDSKANQEPLTINQEPITINKDQLTKETVNDNSNLDVEPKKSTVNFAKEDLNFAHWFYERLLLINPKHKKPSPAGFEKWAGSIRKLRAIDGNTHQEMSDLFMWVNNSEFWKGNILSPGKLRTQWDMLTIQRNKDLNAKPTKRDINAIGKDFYVPEGFGKQQDLYKD